MKKTLFYVLVFISINLIASTIPYQFTSGTPAKAEEVNANFQYIVEQLDTGLKKYVYIISIDTNIDGDTIIHFIGNYGDSGVKHYKILNIANLENAIIQMYKWKKIEESSYSALFPERLYWDGEEQDDLSEHIIGDNIFFYIKTYSNNYGWSYSYITKWKVIIIKNN